jgi:hypothetical protein
MARRGITKVDKLEWRGVVYPIMLNKETGEFSAHIPHPDSSRGVLESFRGDLPTVKADLEKYLKEADGKDLKWDAVILIKAPEDDNPTWRYGGNKENALSLDYVRGFRAKTISGKLLWRDFLETNPDDEDDVAVKMREYNSEPPYWSSKAVELEYTAERWSSLRLITETMRLMNDRLQEILRGGVDKVSNMLHGISEKGAQLLLPAPKKGGSR